MWNLKPINRKRLFFTKKRGHKNPLFNWKSRYWTFLLKLTPKRPAWTIQASFSTNQGPFHWKNRFLNIMLQEKAKVEHFPEAGSKKRFRPKNCEEEELWGENGAFHTEILRGIRQKKNLGPKRAKKWKTGKSENPKNAKLVCRWFWLLS